MLIHILKKVLALLETFSERRSSRHAKKWAQYHFKLGLRIFETEQRLDGVLGQ